MKTPLTIAFDGKRAVHNLTGLGNYSRLVVESLARRYPDHRYLLLAGRDNHDNPRLETLRTMPGVEIITPPKPGGALWRSFGLTRMLQPLGVDLYHGLSGELPLNIRQAGVPTVVTMHDVIYRRLPDGYSLADRLACDLKYGVSCRQATRVIAISECTRRDVMHYYGVAPERIDVIYQGCDDSFRRQLAPDEAAATVRSRGLEPGGYIIQVGTVERRKNLELTIRALSALPEGLRLAVVGRDGRGYMQRMLRLAEVLGVAGRISWLGPVGFDELPALYQASAAVVYPSRYEGFGIPVIEGIASRRPVVAATGSCLEEAGGPGAMYVNPDDPRALANALRRVTTDAVAARTLVMRGLRHIARFDNAKIPARLFETYTRALAEGPR